MLQKKEITVKFFLLSELGSYPRLNIYFTKSNRTRGGDNMKVVAFNGSPRKDGNTTFLVNHVFENLKKKGWKQNWCNYRERKFTAVLPAINVLKIRISTAQ